MSSSKRICNTFADARVAHGIVLALAVTAGGCSADVTRFDFPFFGLTGKGNETASLPTPPDRWPATATRTCRRHPRAARA